MEKDVYELMPGGVTSLPEHEIDSWIIELPHHTQGSSAVTDILEKEEQNEIVRNLTARGIFDLWKGKKKRKNIWRPHLKLNPEPTYCKYKHKLKISLDFIKVI